MVELLRNEVSSHASHYDSNKTRGTFASRVFEVVDCRSDRPAWIKAIISVQSQAILSLAASHFISSSYFAIFAFCL